MVILGALSTELLGFCCMDNYMKYQIIIFNPENVDVTWACRFLYQACPDDVLVVYFWQDIRNLEYAVMISSHFFRS